MRAGLQALAVVAALHVLFFGDVLFAGRSLSPATYTSGLTPRGPYGAPEARGAPHLLDVEGAAWVDEPSPYIAADAWRRGLPLWNPAEGLGAPLAANLNSGAANPLQLPLDLAPGPAAADAFYLARVLLLALATWAYLRALTLAPVAALLGAAVIAYGGYTMAWIAHHPLSVELFLPLMLLGAEHGRCGRASGFALLAGAAAGALVGGKLQAALLCFAFVIAIAAVRGRRREGGPGHMALVAALGALAIGTALAAYLLVPAAELMARATGLTLGGRSALAGFTVPWPALASIVAPQAFAPPGSIWPAGGPLPSAIGMTAAMLAVLGVSAGRSPLRALAMLCGVWAVAIVLRNVGVFGSEGFTRLPIVRGVLFLKYTFTAAFALAVAAAIGLDAVLRGLVPARRAVAVAVAVPVTAGVLLGWALWGGALPVFPAKLAVPATCVGVVVAIALAWHHGILGARLAGGALALATLAELRAMAPSPHPPRLDPYRPPPYVAFLRGAPAGRVIAADDLLTPLTSAAAGLRDFRAIDVLTPGSAYAFFTRLVSFCPRIIHFTVDPDVALAATAPALDLAAVRYVVAHGALDLGDLATRVGRQVRHERLARLLSGLRAIRTRGRPLALGPVDVDGDRRFAFTLTAPSTLELAAESEAPELAWSTHTDARGGELAWRVTIDGEGTERERQTDGTLALAAAAAWQEVRVPLGPPGVPRRIRLRVEATPSGDGSAPRVALGDLGFSPGVEAEAAARTGRIDRQRAEAAALRPVFSDPALGVVVYENENALPRAFRVTRVEPVQSVDEALTRLGDGFDFRHAALVRAARDEPVMHGVGAVAVDPAVAARAGRAEIVRDDPLMVAIATDGPERAVVVLADLSYPGWHATVDGDRAPVLEVDGVLRGVVVEPGPHCIEYRYQPSSWLWGAVVTVLAAVALAPAAKAAARAHRRVPLGGAVL